MFNEDYIKGTKFLLGVSKEQGINIRKVQWVPHVSKMLSEHGVCYKFWYNVWSQNRLNKVPLCNTWYDVAYGQNSCLFCWSQTSEGHLFWYLTLCEVLNTEDMGISECGVLSRLLCD